MTTRARTTPTAWPRSWPATQTATYWPLPRIVLSVSDEMSCSKCHASNTDQHAKPALGWENNSDPAKDVKLNILKRHDQFVDATPYLPQLRTMGYVYQKSLYQTAKSGTPILCATCHSTNALGLPGHHGHPIHDLGNAHHARASGESIHGHDTGQCSHSGNRVLPLSSGRYHQVRARRDEQDRVRRLPWASSPRLEIKRGAAGSMYPLARCATPIANGTQLPLTNRDTGALPPTLTFATNPNKPITGTQLTATAQGTEQLYCSGCHGSPHAEFPTLQANDNVYSQDLQGHTGKIAECTVCHTSIPTTPNGGPHNMHTVGQAWVNGHHDYVEKVGKNRLCLLSRQPISGVVPCRRPRWPGASKPTTTVRKLTPPAPQ